MPRVLLIVHVKRAIMKMVNQNSVKNAILNVLLVIPMINVLLVPD